MLEVTVVRTTGAVYRVTLRFRWTQNPLLSRRAQRDLVITLDGDYEVVTAFWINPTDHKPRLRLEEYEQKPPDEAEQRLLDGLPLGGL